MPEYTVWFTLLLLAIVPGSILFALWYCPPAPKRFQLRNARTSPVPPPDASNSN